MDNLRTTETNANPTCFAIIQAGPTKGSRCFRPQTQDGYCLKHQGVKERDHLKSSGHTLCANNTRGCSTIISPEDVAKGIKQCSACKELRKTKHFPCKHNGCNYVITEDTYCMKHIGDYLRDKEKEDNIKYCKLNRGCRNILKEDQKECDECIDKHRSAIETLYKENNMIVKYIPYSKTLQKYQEKTYSTIEDSWRDFQKRVYEQKRILLAINYEQFKSLVIKPCYYCGFHTTMKVNGIDRINNHKGYILSNMISCCRICNELKYTSYPIAFLDKINAIVHYNNTGIPISDDIKLKWVNTLCSKNYPSYTTYKNNAENVRHIKFNLSEDEYHLLKKGSCYICGIKSDKYNINGIDRLKSSGIYHINNCKTCCGHCNAIKRNYDIDLFLSKCQEINKHNCDRSIFDVFNEHDYARNASRNEEYAAIDIYEFIINNTLSSYIDWSKDVAKTDEHITNIMDIAMNKDKSKEEIIAYLEDELRIEKTREVETNAYITGKNLYNMLILGKKNECVEWIEENKGISSLFHEKLEELIKNIQGKSKQQGVELCRDFMYAEKNRRNRITSIRKITPLAKEKKITKDITINEDAKKTIPALMTYSIQLPKQWKATNIYKFLKDGKEDEYHHWCKENNDISDEAWSTFITKTKDLLNNKEECIKLIEEFIINLRSARQKVLLDKTTDNIIERKDRQQWPSASVLKAYKDGKIDAFKKFTEEYAGDSGEKWEKRWTAFVNSLEGATDQEATKLISAFMAAQRKKKYDRSKNNK